jgi:hypothetical protein
MSPELASALIVGTGSVAIDVHGWNVRGQSDLDWHISEALDVANTRPDYEANVNARWIG